MVYACAHYSQLILGSDIKVCLALEKPNGGCSQFQNSPFECKYIICMYGGKFSVIALVYGYVYHVYTHASYCYNYTLIYGKY